MNWLYGQVFTVLKKATASIAFGCPSGEPQPLADNPTVRGIAIAEGQHLILSQGVIPLICNERSIAVCVVGGGIL